MELFANLTDAVADPAAWARQREAEGWTGVSCADHYFSIGRSVRPFPHVWVTLGAIAAATQRVRLQSAFANNLLRSPVEVAQAVLMVHAQSGGRAEAGLGAGWSQAELDAAGLPFPDGATRARMLLEAVQIVRSLLRTGTCHFDGEHYHVDVPVLGPLSDPAPPLIASLGSAWTLRHVAPLVDRVELSIGRANRTGVNDLATLATATRDEVRAMVGTVRDVAPATPLSLMAFVAAGSDAGIARMRDALGAEHLYGRLVGEPAAVAAELRDLAEDLGIDRLQVTGWTPGSYEALAPHLFG